MRNDRWWKIWFAAGLMFIAITVALAVKMFSEEDNLTNRWGGLVAAAGTIAAAIAAVLSARRSDSTEQVTVADELAKAVSAELREELDLRELRPMVLEWTASDHLSHGAAETASLPGLKMAAGTGAEAIALYNRLPGQRLVILGSPGSGKSVLAMELTLELLRQRQPGGPVPVLFQLSSWNPVKCRLKQWLVARLSEDYEIAPGPHQTPLTAARRLVEEGVVLPILDGLDEVESGLHTAAVHALNDHLGRHQPMILTCRTSQYQAVADQGEILAQTSAWELQPLEPNGIRDYLVASAGGRRNKWQPVLGELVDGPLALTLRSPLMLALARAIYSDQERDPAELVSGFSTTAEIETHLLKELIPSAFRSCSVRDWTDGGPSWLAFLARHTTRLGTADIAWWQLELAAPQPVVHGFAIAVCAVIFGFFLGPVAAAIVGVAAFIATSIPVCREWTVESYFRARGSWVRSLALALGIAEPENADRRFALYVSRMAAAVTGMAYGIARYRADGLGSALAGGLAVGLAVGLAASFFAVSARQRPSQIRFTSYRGARSFARQLALGVGVGGVLGLAAEAFSGIGYAVQAGLILGAALGLLDGVNVWLDVPTEVTHGRSPLSTYRDERNAAIARSVIALVAVASTVAVAFGITVGWSAAFLPALFLGTGYALADRHMGLFASVWGRHVIARAWLAVQGLIPRRLMSFLDFAHRRGVLRRSGAHYQFRHVLLGKHLARTDPERIG